MAVRTEPIPPELHPGPVAGGRGMMTSPLEVGILCRIASSARGNLVEIGAHTGRTTMDLALHLPDRFVYAVDYCGEDVPILPDQRYERPPISAFCSYARHLPNVVPVHRDSRRLNYAAFVEVGMVFIDGDHSLDGVRADTELALAHLRGRPDSAVAWHDYRADVPWVAVKPYLDSLEIEIVHLEGTMLAFARF